MSRVPEPSVMREGVGGDAVGYQVRLQRGETVGDAVRLSLQTGW
jgi:hypothetical protein